MDTKVHKDKQYNIDTMELGYKGVCSFTIPTGSKFVMGGYNKNPKTKYWIKKTIHVCVICGCEDVDQERMYSEKPDRWEERNIFRETACGHHFM